jgi:hypothetical protein
MPNECRRNLKVCWIGNAYIARSPQPAVEYHAIDLSYLVMLAMLTDNVQCQRLRKPVCRGSWHSKKKQKQSKNPILWP